MPIGKDSIKTRVAKTAEPVAEAAEKAAAEKPAAEKPAAETAPAEVKPTAETAAETAAEKPAPKKKAPAKKKPAAPKAEKPAEPATAVLSNVAPETVEAVVGHKEDKPSDKVQIGQKMPNYLL